MMSKGGQFDNLLLKKQNNMAPIPVIFDYKFPKKIALTVKVIRGTTPSYFDEII